MDDIVKTTVGLSGLKVMSGGAEIKTDFVFLPRKQRSHKRVHQVGVNDAPYVVLSAGRKGFVPCPIYKRWALMMQRAYYPKFHKRRPTYVGCSVDPRWHSFMQFREWFQKQDWVGRHLDKDILCKGNKTYSPETCLLVPGSINTLLLGVAASRGKFPIGVTAVKRPKPFRSLIRKNNKLIHLGYFYTVEEAASAYNTAKADYIESLLPTLTDEDPRLIPALGRIIFDLRT